MFDAKALLNSVLGADAAAAVSNALQNTATAASDAADKAQAQLHGTKAGDVFAQGRQLAVENPGIATAAAGGLAALLLGTGAGRRVVGATGALGGLAALGGFAYKAYGNWQSGKPLLEGVPGLAGLTAPPQSGFHADDHSNESAMIVLRAMVATAAADGIVDADEQARILDQMQKSGVSEEATEFLTTAVAHPATQAEIASAVKGDQKLAVQVYTAASLMAEPGNAPEQAYLAGLATALGIPPDLASHLHAALVHPPQPA